MFLVQLSNMQSMSFPAPREEARNAVASGQLFIGRLSSPVVLSGVDTKEPTLKHRAEVVKDYKGLVMTVEQIWYYNVATGRVYWRVPVR